jgi:hypothetical protein
MLKPERLFHNFFDNIKIIPERLSNFAQDTLNNLIANNAGGEYTALIATLQPLVSNFKGEIGQVDTSRNIQKGATLTVDEIMVNFKDSMSSEEPFIARALGGIDTAPYLEFYPAGIDEYSRANKTNMPVLTKRVNVAATAHSAALGPVLTATLQAFAPGFNNARDQQQKQKGAVENNRNERSVNRRALELGLLATAFAIGFKFPGDVKQCLKFFRFNLLFAHAKHKHKLYNGSIAAGGTVEVVNRLFTDSTVITLRNNSDNASLFVWLNDTSDNGEVPSSAIEIKPGETMQVKPSELGPLENPFLLIHNSSNVNEGEWEVEVVG